MFRTIVLASAVAVSLAAWSAEKIEVFAETAASEEGSHYANPFTGGCRDDELAIKVEGVDGAACSPLCDTMTCPSDVPEGVTATPFCALDAPDGKRCALLCDPQDEAKQCGSGACRSISGIGVCTFSKFDAHTERYDLAFDAAEYDFRKSVFEENSAKIAEHNAK